MSDDGDRDDELAAFGLEEPDFDPKKKKSSGNLDVDLPLGDEEIDPLAEVADPLSIPAAEEEESEDGDVSADELADQEDLEDSFDDSDDL